MLFLLFDLHFRFFVFNFLALQVSRKKFSLFIPFGAFLRLISILLFRFLVSIRSSMICFWTQNSRSVIFSICLPRFSAFFVIVLIFFQRMVILSSSSTLLFFTLLNSSVRSFISCFRSYLLHCILKSFKNDYSSSVIYTIF